MTTTVNAGRILPLVMLLIGAGCNNNPPPPANAPPALSGVTVGIAAPAGLRLGEQWRLPLDEWTAATGGDFRLQEIPADAASMLPPKNTALAIVPLAQIPDLIADDWMTPDANLDEDADALADWEESLRGLRNTIAQPAGEPQLIPTACPVLAVYYRADLLAAADRQPPQTWDDYQTLLNELADWSGGMPALEPWGPEFRSSMWLSRAAGYALHPDNVALLLDLQTAEPLLVTPPFTRALIESRDALQRLDPDSLELGPEDCCRAVLEGRAALAIGMPPSTTAGPSAAASVAVIRDGPAVIGTAPLPVPAEVFNRSTGAWEAADSRGIVTLVGTRGYAACVSQKVNAAARRAAWNLWTSLREFQDESVLPFGPAVCRASDVPAAQHQPATGFTAAEWRQHIETAVSALQDTRVLLELPLPHANRFRETLTARLTAAIEDGATPGDVLLEATADWNELIDELDREHVLNIYRQCHALKPL